MRRDLRLAVIATLAVLLLSLAACAAQPETTPGPDFSEPLGTPEIINNEATLYTALTLEQNSADAQAAATAEVMRADAQATLNSANATLNAAQTLDQNNADALATLNSAGATLSAALTQDSIRQTQAQFDLASTAEQKNKDALAAGTETAVAALIATQTQAAAATSQWYADQARQREEQRQSPIAFLWLVCLPTFIMLLAGLALWGVWRWLRIQQANQRILERPVERLQAPAAEIIDHQPEDMLPYLEDGEVIDGNQLTKPDDQVRGWVDEVKRTLRSSDEKDEEEDDTAH